MITFNLQAHTGNFYCGHKPSNHHDNCWSGEEHALVFTIEQARELVTAWNGYLKIVVSVKSKPITDEVLRREVFCSKGGNWYDYLRRK